MLPLASKCIYLFILNIFALKIEIIFQINEV